MYLQKKESHITCTLNKDLFYWAILSICSIAAIFQAVAFFSPAWFSLHADIRTQGYTWQDSEGMDQDKQQFGVGDVATEPEVLVPVDIDLGLWIIRGCVNGSCHTASLGQLQDFMETDEGDSKGRVQSRFLDNFAIIQGLATSGAVTTMLGFISLLFTSRWDTGRHAKCMGFITTLLWALSGILLLVAVAHRKHENVSLEKEMTSEKFDVYFNYPWAIPLCGTAGFMSITVSLTLLCKLLVVDISGSMPGSWIQIGDA